MESKRLLLIEARPQPRALLSRSFENEGFVVTRAAGIAEAALRLNPAPDLVVSSFAVAEGDPLEFCRALDGRAGGANDRAIPFLYLYDRRRPVSVNRLREAHVAHAVGTPTFVRDVILAGKLLAETKEPGRPSFTGALETFGLPALLRVGSQPDRSSLLSLFSRSDEATLALRDGFIVGAEAKNARATITGLRAFDRMAQWLSGGFSIELLPDRADGKVLLALPVALQRIAESRAAFANALGDDRLDWVYEADYKALGAQMADVPRLAVDVAKLMDGKRSLNEILAEARTDEPTTLRIIRRLVDRGIAKRLDAPTDSLPVEVGPRIGREDEAPLPAWDEAPATIIAPTPSLFDPQIDAPKGFPEPRVTTLEKPVRAAAPAEFSRAQAEKSPWSNAPLIPFGEEPSATRRRPTVTREDTRSLKAKPQPAAAKSAEPAPFGEDAFSSDEEAFFINELSNPKIEAVGTWPGVERALVPVPAPETKDAPVAPHAPRGRATKTPAGPDFSANAARKQPTQRRAAPSSAAARSVEIGGKTSAARKTTSRPLSNLNVSANAKLRTDAQKRIFAARVPKSGLTRVLAIGAVIVGVGLLMYGIVAPSTNSSGPDATPVIVGSERLTQRPTTPRDEIPPPPPPEEVRAVEPAREPAEARAETNEARPIDAPTAPAPARATDEAAGAAEVRREESIRATDSRADAPARTEPTTDVATQLRRAERLLAQGRRDAALRAIRVVLSLDADHARARVLLARTLYDQGLVSEAEGHVKKGLAVAPRNAELTLLAGVIAQSKGNRAAATTAFERYLKLSPKGRYADEVREILKGWRR